MATGTIISNNWRLWNTASGNNSITLPSKFAELMCEVCVDNSEDNYTNVTVAKAMLSSTAKGFRSGGYGANTSSMATIVQITTTTAKIVQARLNGTDKASTSVLKVYYR